MADDSALEMDAVDPSAQSDAPMCPLDRRVITVFRAEAAFGGLILVALGAGASVILWLADVSAGIAVLPGLIVLLTAIAVTASLPAARWRGWRYAIGDDEVSLQHGVFGRTSTRMPMARIQHVDTRQGVLDRRLGLATLILYTAAGSRSIPGLTAADAQAYRDRISKLANVRDDAV